MEAWLPGSMARHPPPGIQGPRVRAPWLGASRCFQPVSSSADYGYFQRAAPEPTLCGRASAAVLIRAQVAHSQHIRVRLQPLHNKLRGASRLGSGQGTGTSSQSQIQEVCSSKAPS